MSVTHLAPPTLEEFLQWEDKQAGRFEFLGEVIVAMVGAHRGGARGVCVRSMGSMTIMGAPHG